MPNCLEVRGETLLRYGMDAAETREQTEKWFERVWNRREETAIDELMDDGCEVLGLTPMAIGREGFRSVHRAYYDSFESIRADIADLVAERDAAAGHVRFTGRHRGTGYEVDTVFSFAMRFEARRLSWIRNVIDYGCFLAQLRHFDPAAIRDIFGPGDSADGEILTKLFRASTHASSPEA